jgi:hypothetical protein
MRRTLIVLSGTLTALVASLTLMGSTADASSPSLTWGTPAEVAGALNLGGGASVSSVSCSSVGSCTAGGSYQDFSGKNQAFVVDEVGGAWGTATEVAGALNVGGQGQVTSVSCSSAGNCAVGGTYEDSSPRPQAFVDDEVDGVWGTATEVAGALNVDADAEVASVSCSSAGNCAAGGEYDDGSGDIQAFVVDEVGGVWGTATEIAGALNVGGDAQVFSVSCWSDGNCAAGGRYETTPADSREQLGAFVDDELGGVWGTPTEVAGSLNTYGFAGVNSVSCSANGNCAAGGYYTDVSDSQQGFVVTAESGGSQWGPATGVAGTLNAGSARVNSVSCSSAGNCVAGGFYEDSSHNNQAFLVDEVTGVWGTAAEVAGNLNVGGFFTGVNSVSCSPDGGCAAAGSYVGSSGPQAFVVDDVGGVLGPVAEVVGALAVNRSGASAVSCAPDGSCAAGGYYGDSSGTNQGFVVNTESTPTVAVTSGSAVLGGTLEFSATVSGPAGEPTPTGTVTWTVTSPGDTPATCSSTTALAGLSSAATATCSVSVVVAGQYTVSAAYAGDSNYIAGTSSGSTATVTKATTATNLISSLSPATLGQSVSFTAKVTGYQPSGTVTFLNGATPLATAPLNGSGQAIYTTTGLSVGEQTITASYGGDANNVASVASPLTEMVNAVPTGAATPVITPVGGRSVQVSFGARAAAPTTLRCADSTCSGTVTLTQVKVVTVKRGKKSAKERTTVVLGRAAYSLKAGTTGTVQVKLSNGSAAKLSASRTMTVMRTITVSHGKTVAATVVLRAPRKFGSKAA